jgi:hypothetical protein
VNILGGSDNFVVNNYIGTDSLGTAGLGNSQGGVWLRAGAAGNHIGVPTAASGLQVANYISGNGDNGVLIEDPGTTGNFVQGNFIGTDIAGLKPLPNASNGVVIVNAASGNIIGGSSLVRNDFGTYPVLGGAGNLISGNGLAGVQIFEASANFIQGNFIGTDIHGTGPIPNGRSSLFDGVDLLKGASDNQIGGPSSIDGTGRLIGLGNLISGNGGDGLAIVNTGGFGPAHIQETRNHVEGNFIGTDVTGTTALPNGFNGVHLDSDAVGNFIGGTAPGTRNVISGNGVAGWPIPGQSGAGVQIADFFGSGPDENNLVQNNYIGTDVTGLYALGNLDEGVMIQGGASNNQIGAVGARNLISGNPTDVVISGNTTGNTLLANTIGLGADGQPIAVAGSGDLIVVQQGANQNQLGQAGAGNIISGALQFGIVLTDPGTTNNAVQGNYIGTDPTGEWARPNLGAGVLIANGAANNQIGGAGEGNVISGNGSAGAFVGTTAVAPPGTTGYTGGVIITDSGTSGNILEDNLVGTDVSGTRPLANAYAGVMVRNGASGNVIRRALTGNVISGNVVTVQAGDSTNTYGFGVLITDTGTNNNLVTGNFLGTDRTGTQALGIQLDGVEIANGPAFNQIGWAGKANVISGNAGVGVEVAGQNTIGDNVDGNLIGTDVTGTLPLGNGIGFLAADGSGVYVHQGASITVGDHLAGGNVISGNTVGVFVGGDGGTVVVQANYIGTDITGTKAVGNGIGVSDLGSSTNVGPGNVIAGNSFGVFFDGGSGSVFGNLIGTDVTGEHMLGNLKSGIDAISSDSSPSSVQLGKPGSGNVIAGNGGAGIRLQGGFSPGTSVTANLIGTDAAGTTPLPNGGSGIDMENASHLLVGGFDNTGDVANVIANNSLDGVHINGGGSNFIVGNFIGTDRHEMLTLGNGGVGVLIQNSSGNQVGNGQHGFVPLLALGEGNVIAFNAAGGVLLLSGTGNTIRGNSIFANGNTSFANSSPGALLSVLPVKGGPGIWEVAAANANQPAPVLTNATYEIPTQTLTVYGNLQVTAGITYSIDFFASPAGDPEGKIYLGSQSVNSGKAGLTGFKAPFLTSLNDGENATPLITATATDPSGNTSVFSLPFHDPPAQDKAGPLVYRVYADLLGRPPTGDELTHWTGLMHHGTSVRQVAADLMRGLEYRTLDVQSAYQAYLHRDASVAELTAATGFLASGGTVEQLQVRLVTSAEYWQLEGGTAVGFVNGLYQEALGHAPDAATLASATRSLHPGRVAEAVFASPEYRRDLIDNDYARLLYHAPNKTAERSFLQALAHGARDEYVLAAIFGSAEYRKQL